MFDDNWVYKVIVILALCILLAHTFLTSEDTLIDYTGSKAGLNPRFIWKVVVFAILSLVLFYLLGSILDYRSQNKVFKEYLGKAQNELVSERGAIRDLKSVSEDKIIELSSFIVTISDMAKELNSVLETNLLLRTILIKTSELLGSEKCAIFSVANDKNKLTLVDSIGYDKEKLSHLNLNRDEASGILGLAARDGKYYSRTIISGDYDRMHILEADKLKPEFCQPIVYEEEVLAIICVGDVKKGFSDKNVMRILSTMANFGAVALTNTRLVERIKEQSIRDGLTGLYNHQYFQENLDGLLSDAAANKKPLGLIMMDIDHFKKLNDSYGHQMGDLGLKSLSGLLSSKSKKGDIIARYGGEEFMYVSPGRDLSEIVKLAEEIRNDFKNIVIELEGVKTKCTLSAGVISLIPDKTVEIKKNLFIRMVDTALYEAKEAGRDRVVTAKGG